MIVKSEDIAKGFGVLETGTGPCPHCGKTIVLTSESYIISEKEYSKVMTEVKIE